VTNSIKKPRGKRFPPLVKALFAGLKLRSNAALAPFAQVGAAPSQATIDRHIAIQRSHMVQGWVTQSERNVTNHNTSSQEVMEAAGEKLFAQAAKLGVSSGKLVVFGAIDETVLTRSPDYAPELNAVTGFCGPVKVTKDDSGEHTMHSCNGHPVAFDPNDLPEGVDHMEVLRDIFLTHRNPPCTLWRDLLLLLDKFAVLNQPSIHLLFPISSDVSVAMLTVPMEGIGAVPVYVGLTCNQFTKGDVLAFFKHFRQVYTAAGLETKIGPLIGFASDGDSRRRAAQLHEMLDFLVPDQFPTKDGYIHYKGVDDPTFMFAVAVIDGRPCNIHDQDFTQYVSTIVVA
jgi:hypothetical protein